MNHQNNILIYSDFDIRLSMVIKNLKKTVVADIVMISRDYELDAVLNTMSVELLIINLSSRQLDKALLSKMMNIADIAILFLTEEGDKLPENIDAKSHVFSYPIKYASESLLMGTNVNSILKLSRAKNKEVNTEAGFDTGSMDKNLCRYIMELDRKNKTLATIKSQIDSLCESTSGSIQHSLRSLSSSLRTTSLRKRYWEDFNIYFERVNPNFISKLSSKHPNLTTKDLKYCCYLKMNMSNNDIKNLLSINQESVRTHKYRLKKKLGLQKDESIRSYLQLEVEHAGSISV